MPSRNSVRLNMALGALSFIALLFSHLALTDIYHGEANPALEWTILQVSTFIFVMFITLTLLNLRTVLKQLPQ